MIVFLKLWVPVYLTVQCHPVINGAIRRFKKLKPDNNYKLKGSFERRLSFFERVKCGVS